MRAKTIHVSPSAALSVVLTCTASDALPDMSVVTASRILVGFNGGTEVTWTTTVDSVSPARLVIRHRYVTSVDFSVVGVYTLRVEHDTPNGVVMSRDVLTVNVIQKQTTIL